MIKEMFHKSFLKLQRRVVKWILNFYIVNTGALNTVPTVLGTSRERESGQENRFMVDAFMNTSVSHNET